MFYAFICYFSPCQTLVFSPLSPFAFSFACVKSLSFSPLFPLLHFHHNPSTVARNPRPIPRNIKVTDVVKGRNESGRETRFGATPLESRK